VAAHEGEVAQAAGMNEVEASLVAKQQLELGTGGEVAEGGDEAIEIVIDGGAGVHFVIEDAAFHGEGAVEAPVGGDHFFDQPGLDVVEGAEAFDIHVEEHFEIFGVFVAKEDDLGEESMTESVLRRALLAFGGDRSAGFGAIGARGGRAFFGSLFH
jgi:hypothetical protein